MRVLFFLDRNEPNGFLKKVELATIDNNFATKRLQIKNAELLVTVRVFRQLKFKNNDVVAAELHSSIFGSGLRNRDVVKIKRPDVETLVMDCMAIDPSFVAAQNIEIVLKFVKGHRLFCLKPGLT